MLAGGKRWRPYLAYLGYSAAGGRRPADAFRAGLAIEFLHVFCLVQDDVMDRSAERHGVRTIHEELRGRLGGANRVGDLRHIGDSEAVLCGDLLLGWATDILRDLHPKTKTIGRQVEQFFRTLRDEVILGQILDIDSTSRSAVSGRLVREKTELKSARYSFVRPLQLGIALGGGSQRLLSWAESFGLPLGMAFQLQDDMLDIIGNPGQVGKSLLSDLRQHQHTLLTQFVMTRADYTYRQQLWHWFGGDVETRDRGAIVEMFERSGALDYARRQVAHDLAIADRAAVYRGLRPTMRQAMAELVDVVRKRSA